MSDLIGPREAIELDPPHVWLKSAYGFRPQDWGGINLTRRSGPGALVVMSGTMTARDPDERGKVLGIMQLSGRIGPMESFLSPLGLQEKRTTADWDHRWNEAAEGVRAWLIPREQRMHVSGFARETWTRSRARVIGNTGMQLTSAEARGILALDLVETDVARQPPIVGAAVGPAAEVLTPSRAGPVSQSAYTVREAEGPKHLYILDLEGDVSAFLGRDAGGRRIVKVGMSRSPAARCDALNGALPHCAFRWRVLRSSHGLDGWPVMSSKAAISGEEAMKKLLVADASSLGGEFFLAGDAPIEAAWSEALRTAQHPAS